MSGVLVRYQPDLDGAKWTAADDAEQGTHVVTVSDRTDGGPAHVPRLPMAGADGCGAAWQAWHPGAYRHIRALLAKCDSAIEAARRR